MTGGRFLLSQFITQRSMEVDTNVNELVSVRWVRGPIGEAFEPLRNPLHIVLYLASSGMFAIARKEIKSPKWAQVSGFNKCNRGPPHARG